MKELNDQAPAAHGGHGLVDQGPLQVQPEPLVPDDRVKEQNVDRGQDQGEDQDPDLRRPSLVHLAEEIISGRRIVGQR